MESIKDLFEALINSPHYSFGWVLLAVMSILPAIVSVNLIQHEVGKLFNRKQDDNFELASLIKNLAILLVSISIISYAYYLYVWK